MEPLSSIKELRNIVDIYSKLVSQVSLKRESEMQNDRPSKAQDSFQDTPSLPLTCHNGQPETHWFVAQYCFLLILSNDLGMKCIESFIRQGLLVSAKARVSFALKLRSIIMVICTLLEQSTVLEDVTECGEYESARKKDKNCRHALQVFISTIEKSIPPVILKSQEYFYGNLGCIASYLISAMNTDGISTSTRSNFYKMLEGTNVLLNAWSLNDKSSPITLSEEPRSILNIVIDKCELFPTRNACPFALVIEIREDKKGPMGLEDPENTETKPHTRFQSSVESLYGSSWAAQKDRLRRESRYSSSIGWDCEMFLVKSAEGMLQEMFACQLIGTVARIWDEAAIPVKIHPYNIFPLGEDFALVEFIQDARTIDFLKRHTRSADGSTLSLTDIFTNTVFQSKSIDDERKTQCFGIDEFKENFISSCAGYSVINYVLRIGDRHNKNVLLTRDGCIVHIDFGFVLELTPGGIGMESFVPFKLPRDYVEFMGEKGLDRFRELVLLSMTVLRQNIERVAVLIEMGNSKCLPCLGGSSRIAAKHVRERVLYNVAEPDFSQEVSAMIDSSMGSWITRGYDIFQKIQNGIEN